jgi:HEPN domain-containing protein
MKGQFPEGKEASAVNRAELQQLARERILEARALLAARRWAGAYYLAGYAVECGLKACVIGRLMRTDQFPERKFSEQCWTHNLTQLIGLAGLKSDLDAAFAADPDLADNWDTVKDWSEASRYVRTPKPMAEDLYLAITEKRHGVIVWIKGRW